MRGFLADLRHSLRAWRRSIDTQKIVGLAAFGLSCWLYSRDYEGAAFAIASILGLLFPALLSHVPVKVLTEVVLTAAMRAKMVPVKYSARGGGGDEAMIRVTISGIPGVHTVIATGEALSPPHRVHQVRLAPGTHYGRHRGGDTIAVEAWRCTITGPEARAEPADPGGMP